ERSAVRDVGKALGLPLETVDRLAKTLGKWGHGGQADEVAVEMGVPPQTWQQLCALSAAIEGFPRHLSIHVGGMCITRAPLDRIVPLERATMPGRVVIQWDKDNVEDAGLIKMDLLCLRTLSAIDECLHTIEQVHHTRVDLDALPLDDPVVYKALQTADTIGTFQVESRAQQQALVQMLPRRFSDIVIEVALIRPGPLQGNMVHPFFRRRSGQEPVSYMHPLLKPILAETLGVVIFQEQVIRVAMVMGRFTAGEADLLRRAMSRHRSNEEMARFRERFVAGATSQGVAVTVAENIFEKLAGFASYGFCKSHAAAFAKTAYDTLWLRAHYPAEYYCGVLNNEPMGFYAPRVVVGDAGRHGVRLLPVHVNRSQAACTVEAGAIRLGFNYVDGLGETGSERIVEARPPEGYRNLTDLCQRTRLARRLVENVILAGGMSIWQPNKRSLLWELARIRYEQDELPLELPSDGVALPPMSSDEELIYEYEATGVSTGGHLLELYRDKLQAANLGTSQDLARAHDGQRVRIAGLVAVRQAPPSAKGFAFFSLEDEWGMMNVIFRPDLFKAQRAALAGAQVLAVEGEVQRAKGQTNVLATRGWALR
ncbi:MAG: error-prone DNA polymerase, partial [Chloroflexi bacterium]|nr:error-prone DNA polymerase [Chloroflexota bacterium]